MFSKELRQKVCDEVNIKREETKALRKRRHELTTELEELDDKLKSMESDIKKTMDAFDLILRKVYDGTGDKITDEYDFYCVKHTAVLKDDED